MMMTALAAAALLAVLAAMLLGPFGAGRRAERPSGWAPFFSAEERVLFMELVRDWFGGSGMEIEVGDGVVRSVGDSGEAVRFGLENLAQKCRLVERSEWPDVIDGHFTSVVGIEGGHAALDGRPFEELARIFAVRIWPEDYLETLGPNGLVFRRDLEGTVTALAFDLPDSVVNVTPGQAASWERAEDELFEIGLENVRRMPAPRPSAHRIEGAEIAFLSDDSFYVATRALLFDEMAGAVGAEGTLFGVPNRHTMLYHPVGDLSVTAATGRMIGAILGLYRDGPGSVSPHLYWYRAGRFVTLPFRLEEGTLRLEPPDEFVEALNRLAPPPG